MAVTFAFANSVSAPSVAGDKRVSRGVVTFDSSYPTGGEAITAALFGLAFIDHIVITDEAGADVVAWSKAASKLKAYVRTTGVEVANATDLSALTVGVEVIGN